MMVSSCTTRLTSLLRPRSLPRAGLIFGLLLAGNSLAGCGGSGGSTSQATSQPTASHPGVTHSGGTASASGARSGSLVKAQATALAQAINLTSADLPGYSASPQKESNSKGESEELARCTGAPNPRLALAEVSSENFKRTGPEGFENKEELSSTVTVMPSAALAAKSLAALRNQGEACLEKLLNKKYAERSSEKVSYGQVGIVQIPPEDFSVSGGFGFNITMDVTATHGPFFVLYVDVLAFVEGPLEVMLSATSTNRPTTSATEQHLLSVLAARARTHHP
jgi:hypothetical protein